MRGRGGWATAGCAGFSLAGLLVGIGPTAWLGSLVLDGSGGRGSATVTTISSPGATAQPIDVSPHVGVGEATSVAISAEGFAAGQPVTIGVCVEGVGLVAAEGSCDGDHVATARADGLGHLAATFTVRRLVASSLGPYDCAESAGRCAVVVVSTAGPDRRASVPISFDPGLGRPEITLPG